mmetsp:Transcript_88860/g.275138  ORF Transcript_88860/g.275138 Transcript_88860/m.275138 type:complete len:470 (+) Transcript_88860:1330-2739(+)
MDPQAAAVVGLPTASLCSFEAMDQQRGPGLVHGEALPCVIGVPVWALLGRQKRPSIFGLLREGANRHVCKLVLHSLGVYGGVPTALLGVILVATTAFAVTSEGGALVVPPGGVQRSPELVIELLGVTGELVVGATHTVLLAAHEVQQLVLVVNGFGPLLYALAVLLFPLRRNLGIVGDHRPPKDVDGRVDPSPLLALPALLIGSLLQGLLALLLREPGVHRLRVPVRSVVEDPRSLLRVPVVAEESVLCGLGLFERLVELFLLLRPPAHGLQKPSVVPVPHAVAVAHLQGVPAEEAWTPALLLGDDLPAIQAVGQDLVPTGRSIDDHEALVVRRPRPHDHVELGELILLLLLAALPLPAGGLLLPAAAAAALAAASATASAGPTAGRAAAACRSALRLLVCLACLLRVAPPLKKVLNKVVDLVFCGFLGKSAKEVLQLLLVVVGEDVFDDLAALVRGHLQEVPDPRCGP